MSKPGVFEKMPVPVAPEENLWRFTYKEGPAPMQGMVKARSEASGYRVACAWCEKQGFRAPARVFPAILADESILQDAIYKEKQS